MRVYKYEFPGIHLSAGGAGINKKIGSVVSNVACACLMKATDANERANRRVCVDVLGCLLGWRVFHFRLMLASRATGINIL